MKRNERSDTMTAKTCTVMNPATVRAATGVDFCGKPAVYVEGDFAECACHAAEHGSMASTAHIVGRKVGGHAVGDKVEVHRYGKTYVGTVVYVGARGRVEAEFTYDNGAVRRVTV